MRTSARIPSLTLALAVACAPADGGGVPAGDDWDRFRGRNGAGAAPGEAFPIRFGPRTNVRWVTRVPPGRSSPVLCGGRLFLTADGGDTLDTLSYDRATGARLWRAALARPRRSEYHEHNSPASPSVAVDSETVVAFFPDFGVVAYDHRGRERWREPLGPFAAKEGYGLASSPILVDGKVVLALDQHERSTLLALRARDGEEAWRVERPSTGESWSTPLIHAPAQGPAELIHLGSFALESFDLGSGERIRWTRGTFHEPIGGAVVRDGVAYLAGYGPPHDERVDDAVIRGRDEDGDGGIAPQEIPAWPHAPARVGALFGLADRDGNGLLDAAEEEALRDVFQHYVMVGTGTRSLLAVELSGSGDVTDEGYRWWTRSKGVPEVALPLVTEDAVLFVSDEGGIVTVLDRVTGEVLAQRRVDALEGWCFASPVTAGGRVLIVSHGGTAVVLEVDEGIEVLGTNELEEACYATPALAEGCIYLRTARRLYCFGTESGG